MGPGAALGAKHTRDPWRLGDAEAQEKIKEYYAEIWTNFYPARTSASVLLSDDGVQKHVQKINISAIGTIDALTRPPLAPRTPGDRLSAPPRLAGPAASAGARPRSPYEPFPPSPLLPIDRRRPPRRLPGYELRGLTPCRDRAVQTKIRLTGPRGVRATSIRPDPTPRVHHTP